MRLLFLGTRGYIKDRNEWHHMHSSMSVSFGGTTITIDCGEDWIDRVMGWETRAILVTHAHPDHSWGLKDGAPCPVYATETARESMKDFMVEDRVEMPLRAPQTVGRITFAAFQLEHSTRAPAVGYRVQAGRRTIFYSPDLVYIHDRAEALSGADLYVADARPIVRKRDDRLIGHAPMRTQLTWCRKEGVPRAVFTHCGTPIVGGDEPSVRSRLDGFASERGVTAAIAWGGMELVL